MFGNFGSFNGPSDMPFKKYVETQKQDKYHFLKSPYQKLHRPPCPIEVYSSILLNIANSLRKS